MSDIDSIFDNPKNGANLENKVAKTFRNAGWEIEESQPYIDPDTKKQREIDIIATRNHLVWAKSAFPLSKPVQLTMRLFLDCKNFPNPLGLYVRDCPSDVRKETLRWIPAYSALTREYYRMNQDIPSIFSFHRYLSDSRTTAFKSTNNDEKHPWIQGINQVLHAQFSSLYRKWGRYVVDYPVIVVNDAWNIGFESQDGSRRFADEAFLYEADYVIDERKRHFFIDVVSQKGLLDFMAELDKEFDFLRETIYWDESIQEHSDRASLPQDGW